MFTPSDLGKLIVWGGLLGIVLLTLLAMRGVLKKRPAKTVFGQGCWY